MMGPDGSIITVAGNGSDGSTGDGMLAGLASLSLPTGVVVDSLWRPLISDFGAHRARAVDSVTGSGCASLRVESRPPEEFI